MDNRWISLGGIVEHIGVGRDTIYNWIATSRMPAHRFGGLWKPKKEAVDAWVRSGRADAARDDITTRGTSDHHVIEDPEASRPGKIGKQRRRGGRGK